MLFGYVVECCIERYIVLNHQPLLHPDATFLGFTHCMLSNVFRVNSRSKLSVEIARDDRGMFFLTVILDAFVLLVDVNVRVSCVGEINTGQFDPSLMAFDRGGDQSFAEILRFNDLAFPSSGSRFF